MNILFLGGDGRTKTAFEILKEKHCVSSLGLFEGDSGDISAADAIILPIPATRDNETVNCALTGRKIPLSAVMTAKRGALIITYGYKFGKYPQVDYSLDDAFLIKNAVLTAEGAIANAVLSTNFSLYKSKILVIGFGRVAKALVSRLEGFNAEITVSARKRSDFAVLSAMGLEITETAKVPETAQNYDIIFNTVDVPLFEDKKVPEKPVIFDLSTKGCGIKGGGNYVKLPGLPGKTAQETAGKILAETLENIIKKGEYNG